MKVDLKTAFNPTHTFECGQCFRWNVNDNGVYIGISDGKVCRVDMREIICKKEDEPYWENYFALDTDYAQIDSRLLKCDSKLKPCIEYGSGIRILRQSLWETIISFIISANNNIPRIKKIIEKMCELFGDEVVSDGEKYYAFPTPKKISELTLEDLAPLKAGYRDKYILDAANKVHNKLVDLDAVSGMDDIAAKKELMKIKGVGGKVADCILLFSLGRSSVFPTDVWIKRILTEQYGVPDKEIPKFVTQMYGELSGYAQQYLYYYYRSISDK